MNKERRRQNSEPLYYRLYVIYFQGSKNILKSIKKEAFYRLSILHEEQQIGEMMEGINPAILADKIFLKNAVINFNHSPDHPVVTIRLWFHFKGTDEILGDSTLSLQKLNKEFLQGKEQYHSQQRLSFWIDEEQLTLVYNIFVDKSKTDLNSSIRKLSEKEKAELKNKRISSSKEKELKIAEYHEIILTERRTSLVSEIKISKKSPKNLSSSAPLEFKIKQIKPEIVKTESVNMEQPKEEEKPIEKKTSGNFLEINSATTNKIERHDKNINKIKEIIEEIDQKKEIKTFSSVSSSFQPKTQQSQKHLSFIGGGTSVISDGSEQSEMLANNLSQTYSQRAIAKFKATVVRFLNITFVILSLVLLYFLFVPHARFTKHIKAPKNKPSKMSEGMQQN